jgi:predicted permease
MHSLKAVWRHIRYLSGRSRFRSELNDELESHVGTRAEELEQHGIARQEALAQARRELGSTLRAVEGAEEAWQIRWLAELAADTKAAARALRRNPGFAAAAIACLALGIGANTTIFSVITTFLFSLPSCRDAASVVAIRAGLSSVSSIADYRFMRDAHVFDGMAGLNPEHEVNWRNGSQSIRLFAGLITEDYFTTLGIPMLFGRGTAPGESNTVVLSHRFWSARLARDPNVLGRAIELDGRLYSVVGVLPADHRTVVGFGYSPDLYVPTVLPTDYVQLYARFQSATKAALGERFKAVLQELDRIDPKNGGKRASNIQITGVSGLDMLATEQQLGPVFAFFGMVATLVGLVLMIACSNVAGLLLARASSRSQELAIRLSLGASRTRLVRHLLAESLLIAFLGAVAGITLDAVAARLLASWTLPLPVPVRIVITPDWRLLIFSVAMVLVSAIASGLAPALKAVRKDLNIALKSDQRQVERAWGFRGALVIGQIAASTVLLTTGFLFIHNLMRATSADPGFDTRRTLWASMRLVPGSYKDETRQFSLVRNALDHLRGLPGVEAVAITQRVPLNDNCVIGTGIRPDGSGSEIDLMYECNNVGPDYFRVIGIPLLRGREFSPADRKGGPAVAIVNESFARAVFRTADPIGRNFSANAVKTMQVVGVVQDSKYFTLGEKQRLAVYEPYFANPEPVTLSFMVRTGASPSNYVKPITEVLDRLDPTAAIDVKPMSQALGFAMLPSQAGAAILGATGILGLVLAAIGLYGILLYSVARRTREIGLRVALGAAPSHVLWTIFRSSFSLTGVGLVIGLALALLVTRPVAMFLVPGLHPSDPATFAAVIAILAAVAVFATVTPAVRALRVDPVTALRHE